MAFWRLHYHLVWATYQREPLLVDDTQRQIYGALLGKAKALRLIVHAIGSMPDHIQLAVSIPPKLAVAECVRQLKGASAHYVNHLPNALGNFGWQDGYGALSFGERSLRQVIAYVKNQKRHHREGSTMALYERITEADEGLRELDSSPSGFYLV